MIVRKLQDILGTEREVHAANWTSRRLLLRNDRMGFSMHDTVLHAGTVTEMCYENHLEAVYCIEGRGTLRSLVTNEEWIIEPGTIYALDQHDRHVLTVESDLRMVCVFNPPLVGNETHNERGAYPAAALEEAT